MVLIYKPAKQRYVVHNVFDIDIFPLVMVGNQIRNMDNCRWLKEEMKNEYKKLKNPIR